MVSVNHAVTGVGGGDLMSSIATVRQLLMQDFSGSASSDPSGVMHSLTDELSAVQQSRYEDRMKMEEERKAHTEMVEDLRRRLEEAEREGQQEKAARRSLEETNEALEKHMEELSSQLDSISSLNQSSLLRDKEDSTATEKRIRALEVENEALLAQVSARQVKLEEMRQTSEGWKIQCLASQRQVQELQIQFDSFKKQYCASEFQDQEILQGKVSIYESFQKRLEESVAARKKVESELQAFFTSQKASSSACDADGMQMGRESSAEWKQKYVEAESERVNAQHKIEQLELQLEAIKRGKSKEVTERALEGKGTITATLSSLQTSFDIMKEQADALKKEVEDLEKGSESSSKTLTDKLKGKKEAVARGMANVEAFLESLEGQLKDKLALAKAKVAVCSSEFKRAREDLHLAKEAVMGVEAEILECQRKLKELLTRKKDSSSGRVENLETPSTVGSKESPPGGKGRAAPKKNTSSDDNGAPNKRKKTS